jgi:hypothetical protein
MDGSRKFNKNIQNSTYMKGYSLLQNFRIIMSIVEEMRPLVIASPAIAESRAETDERDYGDNSDTSGNSAQ